MSVPLSDPAPPAASPITTDVLQSTAAKIGVRVPQHLEAEYTEILSSVREAMEQVMEMDGACRSIMIATMIETSCESLCRLHARA